MKTILSATHALKSLAALAAMLALIALPSPLFAASGVWTNTASGGLWSATANWTNGIVADASGFTADFNSINIATDPTVVHLDSARTLGNLTFGDTTTSSAASWILDNNATAANILTLAGGTPTITVNALGTGKTATVGPVIAGSTAWVKAGAGILVLTNNGNTFSGGFTVNAGGTLVANAAGALGTNGSATVNGILDLNAGAVTYTGLTNSMSGSGTVNVVLGTGSATTALNANNSGFNGVINLGTNGLTGAVAAAGAGKVQMLGLMGGSAVVNALANSTLIVNSAITNPAALNLFGGDTGESLGQLRIESAGVWSGPVTLAGAITGAGDGTMGANSGVGTVSGNITETGGSQQFIKVGGGTLVLSGTNKWTGPTIVNGGTLTLLGNQTNYGGIYVGTNTTAETLNIGSGSQTTPTIFNVVPGNVITTHSAGTAYSTINAAGANGLPTYVTNNSSLSIGRDSGFSVGANGNWLQTTDVTVQANGGYPGNFAVSAGGTFTYTGTPLITNSAPASSGNATMTISGGGNFITGTGFYFNDSGTTGKPILVLADGGTITLTASIAQLITDGGTGPMGTFLVGTNGTLNTAGFTTTITNIIANNTSQNGSLVVSGGGKLTLSALNTYTGGTTVTNNTTLVLANGGATGAIRNNLTIQPGAVVALTSGDNLGYVTCVTNVNIYGGLLTNTGAGLYQSYSAYYNLSGGTVGSAGGPFSFSGQGIASLSNSVLSVFNAPVRLVSGSTLTLSADAGSVPGGVDLSIRSGIYQSGGVSGVTKNGAGVVQLNGNNSYGGSTLINAGSLVLSATATLSATTNISVAAGATFDVSAVSPFTLGSSQALGGSGTVNGSVSDSGGSQFNPGGIGTVGTLTITTNLTLAGGDILNFDFSAGGSNDVINVGGTLTPSGTTTINLANWPVGGFLQTNYVLLQAANLGGSAGNFTLQNVPSGGRQTYNIIYDTSGSPQKVLLQVGGFSADLVWQGGGGNAWDVQLTQDWLNGGVADWFYTSDNVLFSNVPPANAAVSIAPASIAPGSVTFNTTNNYVFTGGYITGSANLTKNGNGSVTLTTANDYTGGTTINGGTLQLGDGVANNGSVAGAIANNAVLVISNASAQTLNNNISGSGQTIAGGANSLVVAGNLSGAQQFTSANIGGVTLSGTNSHTGGIAVNAGKLAVTKISALGSPSSGVIATVNSGATFAYQIGGTQTLTNQVTGAGAMVYSNATPGSLNNGLAGLKLTASNSFSGGLTMSVGSVYAYNNNALGSGPVTIDNGNLGGGNYYNQLFVGNGQNISNAITIVNASDYFDGVLMVDPGPNNSFGASDTNSGTFSGPITIASGATVQHGGIFCGPGSTGWLTVAGPVTNLNVGAGIGSRNGRTRFSGGGDYSSFGVGGGVTQIGANNGICTNAVLQISGGSFDLNGYNQTFTGLSNPGGGSVSNSSTNSTSTLTLNLSASSTYSSVLSGNLNLVLNGSSLLNLTGTNTYKGNTTVNGGTLELAVATLPTNSTVAVAGGATLQLDFATTNQVGSFVTNGTAAGPGVYNSTTAAAAFIAGSGSLLVVSTIATNPTNITASVSGSTLTLTWPGTHLGWYAQSNSVSLGDTNYWFDIVGSQGGTNLVININPAQPNVFYRLRKP
jgi:fibronectin-binding autotransporter adhesin